MKSLGFAVTTAEGHFLSRYAIKKEPEGYFLDTEFDKDVLNSLSVKRLKDANETKKILITYHPNMKFWVIGIFKEKGRIFFKSATDETPPWFKTQHDRFGGLFSA